jgi:hypothetical protein
MAKNTVLMICCVGMVAAAGCAADAQDSEGEQTQAITGGLAPDSGAFHEIFLSNTDLCLEPQGQSLGSSVPLVVATCDGSAVQSWLFDSWSGGYEILNQATGDCIYSNDSPPTVGGVPFTFSGCVNTTTGALASNALWKVTTTAGFTTIQSEIGHRNSNLCIDTPTGSSVEMYTCDGIPNQVWNVGQF